MLEAILLQVVAAQESGYAGSQDYNLGMDLHSGYALSDHFAIMINKYNRWERNNGANDFAIGDSAYYKI